jgi:hypothetical protein
MGTRLCQFGVSVFKDAEQYESRIVIRLSFNVALPDTSYLKE